MVSTGLEGVLSVLLSKCCTGGFTQPGPIAPILPLGSGDAIDIRLTEL